MRVAIAGCGLIGNKRASALRAEDQLVGCFDIVATAAEQLAAAHGGDVCASMSDLLALSPDVVVVAVTHDQLAPLGLAALEAGTHLLVEKPAGISAAQVGSLIDAAERAGRQVKVGFNHRFHPGIRRAVEDALSGVYGDVLHMRARYGHGGRPGYDREWRADAARSGGGEIVDQGIHLLDLSNWLLGPLPLHSALLRTEYWDTQVDDNAALLLGAADSRTAPWTMLHVSWTEWKNMFSLEIYCRTAKFMVDGLVRSYGPQTLTIHRMRPELGPPDTESIEYPAADVSWQAEWEHFCATIADGGPVLGGLEDARYTWEIVEAAYAASGYDADRASRQSLEVHEP